MPFNSQVRVNGKRNEIAATPALPDINGMTVKADAMHTQQATAEAVAAGCRDDILPEFVKRHGRFLH